MQFILFFETVSSSSQWVVIWVAGSAQRVGFFNIGSGWVVDKIPGSGLGSGKVGVSKNTIGYFQVSFLLSGISGISRYFWVFLCLPIYTRVIF